MCSATTAPIPAPTAHAGSPLCPVFLQRIVRRFSARPVRNKYNMRLHDLLTNSRLVVKEAMNIDLLTNSLSAERGKYPSQRERFVDALTKAEAAHQAGT